MSEQGTITIKKDALWKYSTFLLIAVVLIGGFVMFKGTGQVVNNPSDNVPGQTGEVKADIDDDSVLGNKNAEVTIIEFSDYECPFCGRFYTQTLPSIKEDYIDTGKVNLVFRDFPLTSIHPNAQMAAEATECAKEQGGDDAFWKMHDKLFENQASLSSDSIKSMAKGLGYDISNCLDSGKFRSEVQKDTADAQAAGGQGTPYFVVIGKDGKGTAISGAQPYANFQQVIESKL